MRQLDVSPADVHSCRACGQDVPLSQMAAQRRGVCKFCWARRARLRKAFDPEHRARHNELTRSWYLRNRDKVRAYMRQRRYQLSPEEYEARLKAQGGRCDLCDLPPAVGELLVVDHDHMCCSNLRSRPGCGRCVRGLIHPLCNIVEGLATDELIAKILAYRVRHGGAS